MKRRDPAAKVLIFSQFTSMLDILHYRLTQVGSLLAFCSVSAFVPPRGFQVPCGWCHHVAHPTRRAIRLWPSPHSSFVTVACAGHHACAAAKQPACS